MNQLSAQEVLNALARKHKEDVFVPECKTGSSSGRCPRLDAWVMKRSWAHPCVIGYEIKVSRSDFLRDKKWQNYLDFCNQLYFVCPWKLITPEEIPEDVGLAWVSRNLSRVIVKRKARYRNPDIPEGVFRYILMSRSRITRQDIYRVEETGVLSRAQRHAQRVEEALTILREKQDTREVGRMISGKLRKSLNEQIDVVARENTRLKKENEALECLKTTAVALGIDIRQVYGCTYSIKQALERYKSALRCDISPRALRSAAEAADTLARALEEIETCPQDT